MPKEAPAKEKPQRWEGTHLYNRGNPQRRRTVAQVHEDLAKAKGEREKSRLLGGTARRNSLPSVVRTQGPSSKLSTPDPGESAGSETQGQRQHRCSVEIEEDQCQRRQSVEIEEVFFDASRSPPPDPPSEDEEMPGSNKKKRNASGGIKPPGPATNPTGEGIDPCLKGFLLSIKEELQASTREAADRMTEKMDKRLTQNEKNIEELKARMDVRDKEIESKIATEVAKLGTATGKRLETKEKGQSRREEAFHYCRRSLKIWPVEADDLEDGVKVFMRNELGLPDGRIRAIGVIEASPAAGRAARERKEIIATFETKEDRDSVKAAGINLAGKKHAGMSIHVPGHLLDNYFALNAVGYSIKSKHEGVKRSVKFDDVAQDVYLDIYVGGQWKKVTPDEARVVQKKLPQLSNLSSTLTAEDLSSLVQGNPVAGLTAVVVADDGSDQ